MSLTGRVLPLVLGVLLAAGPASAQSYSDPGLGLGGHVHVSKGVDAASVSVSGGIQARFRLTGGLGIELLATYRAENQEVAGTRILRLEEIPIQASILVFLLSSRRVQPYLVAGGGYYRVAATTYVPTADTTHENDFGLHAGIGIDVRTSLKTSVFGDARFV